jgi:hypothetical protein
MRRDPIVEEVRRNREAIARELGNGVDAIVAALRQEDIASGVSTVSFPPKRLLTPATRQKVGKRKVPNVTNEPTRSQAKRRAAHS